MLIDHRGIDEKKCQIRSTAARKESRDLLLKFLDTLHISGTVGAKNLKFGMQIDYESTNKNMQN